MINNIEKENTTQKETWTSIKTEVIDALQNNSISLQLWRSKQTPIGRIQNIQVYIDNLLVIDSDKNYDSGYSNTKWFLFIIINDTDREIQIATNDKNDVRYISKNQAYIGDINIPEQYRGRWLAEKIYQEIANTLHIEIVKWDSISTGSQSFWDKHKSFKPQS